MPNEVQYPYPQTDGQGDPIQPSTDNCKYATHKSDWQAKCVMDNDVTNTVKRYILTSLGYPNVEVELCDEHLENAIKDAIKDFERFNVFNALYYWTMPLANNVTEYDLPCDCMVVRDVIVMRTSEFDHIFGTDVLVNPLYLTNATDVYRDIITFWLSEAAYETWRRVYGLNISWDIVSLNKRIRIYPTPGTDRIGVIKGTKKFKPEDLDERAFGTKMELFERLALAYAKRTLGYIRGKYPGGVASSQGPVQLDGQELRQEAREDLENIHRELSNTGRPLGFYAG